MTGILIKSRNLETGSSTKRVHQKNMKMFDGQSISKNWTSEGTHPADPLISDF
jgi:hypothetical protein